jgi:branched-chain amino acid transport system substrate-binding protein
VVTRSLAAQQPIECKVVTHMRQTHLFGGIAAIACLTLTVSGCAGGSSGSAGTSGSPTVGTIADASSAPVASSAAPVASSAATESGPAGSAPASSAPTSSGQVAGSSISSGKACAGSIGFMGPITGGAAAIGGEQLHFAQLAVDTFNAQNKSTYDIVQGDTQLDPGQASTVAQQFVSNNAILGVVGPAGSQEVDAVGAVYDAAHLAFVSASATATELTAGKYPTFFRTIPNDAVQGPTDATFIHEKLNAKNVVILQEKTSYGQGLAASVGSALKSQGIMVTVVPVSKDQPDYSAVVTKVADDTDVVFATFQIAANTQVLATQLKQQGKKAVVFGSDGSFSADFNTPGAYVSSFAPDVKSIPSAVAVVKAYTAKYGDFATTYGPPTYVATQAILLAAQRACQAGSPDRAAVLAQVTNTKITDSILGGTLKFTANGDVDGAKFYVFKIGADDKPQLVQ